MRQLFQLAYVIARACRDWYWAVKRPHLYGVRTIVVAPDNSVLLVRHRAGPYAWVLPGGGVGRNENIADAAAREIQEEAGIHIAPSTFTYHGRFEHRHHDLVVDPIEPVIEVQACR